MVKNDVLVESPDSVRVFEHARMSAKERVRDTVSSLIYFTQKSSMRMICGGSSTLSNLPI